MIKYNSHERIDAQSALNHEYFDELKESTENKENYAGNDQINSSQNKLQNGDLTALKDSTNEDATRPLRYVKESENNGHTKHL